MVVHCLYNKPSYLEWEYLNAHHILPEGTTASGLTYKKSEKYAEMVCADGLRISSSPHRLLLSSPSSRDAKNAGTRLRPVLDRYLAAAPEVVCNAIDIKPVAEIADSEKICVPLLLHAAVAQYEKLPSDQSNFQVLLNGGRLSISAGNVTVSQDHGRTSTVNDLGIMISADYKHVLNPPREAHPNVGSIAARSSASDVDQFRQLIENIIEHESVERFRNYTLEDFDDLALSAKELGMECPSEETQARAGQLALAFFDKHPRYYMVEPAEDAGITISTSAEDRHTFTLFVFNGGKAECHLSRNGKKSCVNYATTDGLPDEFLLDAVAAEAKQALAAS